VPQFTMVPLSSTIAGDPMIEDRTKAGNYNERFLEFIKLFAKIGADSRIFPKTCRTCGRVYRNFPEYLQNTVATAHSLEEYGDTLDATFTMQYRNCRCGSTLTVVFTRQTYPLLERFWHMLAREAKEAGKPLREVVSDFREQCNRYISESEDRDDP
jgi:hypothetical protein